MTGRLVDMLERFRSDQAATTEALLEKVRGLKAEQAGPSVEPEVSELNGDQVSRVRHEHRQSVLDKNGNESDITSLTDQPYDFPKKPEGATNSSYYRARLRESVDPESLKLTTVFYPH